MPLPNRKQIEQGSFSSDGSPWILIVAKSPINPSTLEYSQDGSPWYGSWDRVRSVTGTWWSNIKKIGGVLIENVKKIGGI